MKEICCSNIKVRYLKKSGKVKEFQKTINVAATKMLLDSIANHIKFKRFIDVKMSHVCLKSHSDTETNSEFEYEGDVSDNSV